MAVTRHATGRGDYLRGAQDGQSVLPAWEQGYALLEQNDFSFDLQCAPAQLPAAAQLVARYPNIPVVIDHLGKPRTVVNQDGSLNTKEIERWRTGMKAMAALPHVYCKISMLGYAVPGWCQTHTNVMADLVREVVGMFGPQRCMVGLNWWKDGAMSDADGLSDIGPSPVEFLQLCVDKFFFDYSDEDRQQLFCETARKFYRMARGV